MGCIACHVVLRRLLVVLGAKLTLRFTCYYDQGGCWRGTGRVTPSALGELVNRCSSNDFHPILFCNSKIFTGPLEAQALGFYHGYPLSAVLTDCIVVIAGSVKELDTLVTKIKLASEQGGLKLNTQKTKVMKVIGDQENIDMRDFIINVEKTEKVDNYIYLGATFINDCSDRKEMRRS